MNYMMKLKFAAYWFLPQNEAEEVVADYREMLADGVEDPEKRFGSPVKAVLELTDRKKALYWHVYFAVCAVLLAVPMLCAMKLYFEFEYVLLPMLLLAVMLFRKFGLKWPKLSTVPKAVYIVGACVLVVLAAQCVGIYFIFCIVRSQNQELMKQVAFYLNAPGYTIVFLGLCALGGIASLVCARMLDRRWRAVTLLIMTVMLVCIYYFSVVSYMGPVDDWAIEMYLMFHRSVTYSLFGVTIAGVGLC